jgi:hypothetical protein
MAASALTPVDVARTGVDIAGVAANVDGNFWTNTGAEMLLVTNGGGSPINVTLVTQATVDGNAVADPVVAVGNGVTKAIGPFPRYVFNDATGYVQVTYSAVTSVTVKVLRLTAAGA